MEFYNAAQQEAWEQNSTPDDMDLYFYICHSIKNGIVKVDYKGHYAQELGPYTYTPGESMTGYDRPPIFWLLSDIKSAFHFLELCRDLDVDWTWPPRHSIRRSDMNEAQVRAMAKCIELWMSGEKSPRPLPLASPKKCGECGKAITLWFDGETISLGEEECAHPGGLKDYKVDLDIPSGEIVVANDLRKLMGEDVDHNIDGTMGMMLTTRDYARLGMFHAFVGNSCPSVWKNGDVLRIGSPPCLEETDEPSDEVKANWGDEVSWVCTDLWWFSIMDANLFESRCKTHGVEFPEYLTMEHVKVTPGRYRMTVHKYPDNDYYEGNHYATIELVDES